MYLLELLKTSTLTISSAGQDAEQLMCSHRAVGMHTDSIQPSNPVPMDLPKRNETMSMQKPGSKCL